MSLSATAPAYLEAIETEMQAAVQRLTGQAAYEELRHMLAYHLGWEGEGAGPAARGKRIRPLLVALTCAAAGGDWQASLPAAAAVELLHNFSLIHDDIEDNSPLRRGRATVWTKWGIPQAINAGDALLSIAHLALLRLSETTSPTQTVQAADLLQRTCLHLTQGQYLDISFETRSQVTVATYWQMVGGKTAALTAACTELGALVADASPTVQIAYQAFGRDLGLAFQAQDDLLGIWGLAELTGKSAESDLVSGKKSLPVLYGVSQGGPFAARWAQGAIQPDEVPELAAQLAAEGGRTHTEQAAARLTGQALAALEQAGPRGAAGAALRELAETLLGRQA